MLFIRRGVRCIFIRTDRSEKLSADLREKLGGKECSFEEGLTEAREFNSLIFLTPPNLDKTNVEDAERILFIPKDSSIILAELFQKKLEHFVSNVQLGPGIILLRVVGDGAIVEEDLAQRFDARSMGIRDAIRQGEIEDTIILLSATSLSKVVSIDDFISQPLLINQPLHKLYWDLRAQGVQLITKSLEKKEWYEMRINIYDAAERYEVHYERLVAVLSDLDIGMVLGETWTRDHALALMSVLAYQVRLFSLEPPKSIKRILMGLEYDGKGARFVDMDLYYRNRKVNKNDKGVRDRKTESHMGLRRDLYKRLSPETLLHLQELEDSLEAEN